MAELHVCRRELIVGGQKSGKSVRAECLAREWLQADASHLAILLATAQPWDDEMRERIARHQQARAQRVPGMRTLEEPVAVAQTLSKHSNAQTFIEVDCLTLWLTNWMMPMSDLAQPETACARQTPPVDALCEALLQLPGPVVIVSNEIGLGVIPMGAQVRAFVDALGVLNQRVASVCERVTLMAAGLPLVLKEQTT